MSAIEDLLDERASRLAKRTRELWAGHERQAVIEIVRAADEAAFLVRFSPDGADTQGQKIILHGVASALAVFLPVRNCGAGLRYQPSTKHSAEITDSMLYVFGQLAAAQRLAALERYGLSQCVRLDQRTVEIEVSSDAAEEMDRAAGRWLSEETRHRIVASQKRTSAKQIVKLLDRTSDIDPHWGIRYDSHKKLRRYYRQYAEAEVLGCAESEALPGEAQIGGRSFSDWRMACTVALGSVFNHIAYATRLRQRHPDLLLRNLLTIPVLRKDIVEVWIERGEQQKQAEHIVGHLGIDAETIKPWQEHHEIPAPFYVDIGSGWLLLPVFGGLLNPVCALVRALRLQHRRDWDAAVGGRERDYRADLARGFAPPRFFVAERGFTLRRGDGTHLTDIDAVVLDTRTGTLALLQLKWPDIFGLSPQERESRRLNLLKANEWVERVHKWIAARTAQEVARVVGLPAETCSGNPILLVLPRYTARFSRNDKLDERAGWVAWPEVVRRQSNGGGANPLTELANDFCAGGQVEPEEPSERSVLRIDDLEVLVNVT